MKRFLCLMLVIICAALPVLALTSCGAPDAAGDLDRVRSAGKIVVGMECNYAPYNWAQATTNEYASVKLSNGMYADGYDVQIAKRIAAGLGVELEIRATDWNGLIPALTSGEVDFIIAGMSPTAERKLSIDFTDTYYNSHLVMVVRKDSAYAAATTLADFSGARITGQINTFHYKVIDQIDGVSKQPELEDFAALIQSLASGAIDGYVCERPGAISAITSHPEFTYVEFAEGHGFVCDPAESSIAVGVRKGSSLTAEVNRIFAGISDDEREEMMSAAIARQPSAE